MRATKRNGAQQWRTLFPLMGDDRQQGDRQATTTTTRTATIIMTLAMAKDASPNRKFQSTRSQYRKNSMTNSQNNCELYTAHTAPPFHPPLRLQYDCLVVFMRLPRPQWTTTTTTTTTAT